MYESAAETMAVELGTGTHDLPVLLRLLHDNVVRRRLVTSVLDPRVPVGGNLRRIVVVLQRWDEPRSGLEASGAGGEARREEGGRGRTCA